MSSSKSNELLHFPSIIGFSDSDLKKIIESIDGLYNEWEIIKQDKNTGLPATYKDGTIKKRFIRPSKPKLEELQIRIKSRVLEKIELPKNIHGGRKKKSNITNAKEHQGKKYVLTTDLKEFFPSVKPALIHQAFLDLNFNKQFAYYIMRFVTWKGELPQGTPTSTHIANIVFLKTDYLLIKLCEENDITYTRFVDDLTFSSQKDFQHLVAEILKIVTDSGFKLSYRKTFYKGKQTITGIQVFNNKIDASEKVIEKVEAEKLLSDDSPKHLTMYRKRILETNRKSK
ncbi:reverse transcriptase family protein [Flavobacterium sp. GCM10027622]|uniref:reverse transcriptase family protein n=1 Tax=unclassified Flavobacterium TaxID=196869 RepID=UPI0036198924